MHNSKVIVNRQSDLWEFTRSLMDWCMPFILTLACVYLQTKEFNGAELMEFYKVTPACLLSDFILVLSVEIGRSKRRL